jgi:hypothetical protein
MIIYFRHDDGRISTRELGEPAGGVHLAVAPPAGATLIEEQEGRAELERLEMVRQSRREERRAELLAGRRGVYDELVALGVSPTAAGLLAGVPVTP